MDLDSEQELTLERFSTLIRQAELYHQLKSRLRGHMMQSHPQYADLDAKTDEASARVAAYVEPCMKQRLQDWSEGHALFSKDVQKAFEKGDAEAARKAVAECIERKHLPFPRMDANGNDIGFEKAEAERARRLVAVFADEKNVLQLPQSNEAILQEIARNDAEIASWNDPTIHRLDEERRQRLRADRSSSVEKDSGASISAGHDDADGATPERGPASSQRRPTTPLSVFSHTPSLDSPPRSPRTAEPVVKLGAVSQQPVVAEGRSTGGRYGLRNRQAQQASGAKRKLDSDVPERAAKRHEHNTRSRGRQAGIDIA